MDSEKEARVIEAATSVFLRYGFRRTTMGDLAQAAGMSRPALYLLFCNKERIFEAALRRLVGSLLEEIRTGLEGPEPPMDKLRFAFECWAIRPFMMMQDSPDARDLINCGLTFAEDLLKQCHTSFEALLVTILAEFPGPRPAGAPSLPQIAHILAVSMHGFKGSARNVTELREMIEGLLQMAAASLQPSR